MVGVFGPVRTCTCTLNGYCGLVIGARYYEGHADVMIVSSSQSGGQAGRLAVNEQS